MRHPITPGTDGVILAVIAFTLTSAPGLTPGPGKSGGHIGVSIQRSHETSGDLMEVYCFETLSLKIGTYKGTEGHESLVRSC